MQITSIERQSKNKNRYSVFIDGSFAFGMSDESLYLCGIKEGDKVSAAKLQSIKENIVLGEARDKAFKYLSYSMRSKQEMINKLKQSSFPDDIIDETINFLEDNKYINDMEYAVKFSVSRVKAGYGKQRIRSELRLKGIDSSLIDEALIDSGEGAVDAILNLLHKKIKSDDKIEFNKNERQKVYGFLSRRGYNYDDITTAIKAYWEEQST